MTPRPLRLLDTVALLADRPDDGLIRGQVGTLVETLAEGVWLVEFADDQGRTVAMPALRDEEMLALRTAADAA